VRTATRTDQREPATIYLRPANERPARKRAAQNDKCARDRGQKEQKQKEQGHAQKQKQEDNLEPGANLSKEEIN
jgi:hypothetical protein